MREPQMREGQCVHCSKRGAVIGEPCKFSRHGHQSMDLPEGKTCADCIHVRRCVSMFGRIPADEQCDFFPVRYQEAK